MRSCVWLVLPAMLTGCQDDIATPFPPGLDPFDDDGEAAALAPGGDEQLAIRAGDDGLIRVYGRGFVLAEPAAVWAAAQDPLNMVARCSTTTQTVTDGPDPSLELNFSVHYFVDNIVNVEWDDEWRGAVIDESPLRAMIKHQKVQGSDFITTSEGTIQLFATGDPGRTELQLVEHLKALTASTGQVRDGMTDNFARLVAAVHGAPRPGCP